MENNSICHWRIKAKLPHCELWQNSMNRMTAEAYPVHNYHRSHARINRNKPHVVNSYGCCYDSKTDQSYLLIEPIPCRLAHLSQISADKLQKIMEGVLKGLDELEQIYGYIGLTQDCICFTQKGSIKIWVNPDLSSIHPIMLCQQKAQNTINNIIVSICQMLNKKATKLKTLQYFIQLLQTTKIFSFQQAFQLFVKINKHQTQNQHHFIKPIVYGHHRNMSFHQKTSNLKHQRSHSQLDSQMVNNRKNIAQQQTKPTKFCPHLNKSASTVKQGFYEHKKKPSNYQNLEKQVNIMKQLSQKITTTKSTKNIEQEKTTNFIKPSIVKTSICPYICEDLTNSQQTQINGQFKTFGILQQNLQKKLNIKTDQEKQSFFNDFDISALDRQIQRRINHKQKQKKQKDVSEQNDSGNEILKQFLQNRQQTLKRHEKQNKMEKQGIYSKTLNPNLQSMQQKQKQKQKYKTYNCIDQKYQKYIKNKSTTINQPQQKYVLTNSYRSIHPNILMPQPKSISLYANKPASASNKDSSFKLNPIRIS